MRVKRTDSNQAAIVARLRADGWAVHLAHEAGRGFPDLVVSMVGIGTFLVEVKDGKGKLNPRQKKFHQDWIDAGGESIITINSIEVFYAWLIRLGIISPHETPLSQSKKKAPKIPPKETY